MNNQSPSINNIGNDSYIGYYGKIPDKGDFISKNLPISFTEPWHRWIKEAVACSKGQLRQTWEASYLTAPLYQYVLSPGICGNAMWLGVVIPSIDKIGRYYPMTLCKTISINSNPFTVFEYYQTWLKEAESLLLSCLDEDFSLERFDANLTQLAYSEIEDNHTEKTIDDESTRTLQYFTLHHYSNSTWQIPLLETKKQNHLYPALLKSILTTCFSSYSLWRTEGSDAVSPSMIITDDLPPYQSVAALIDGQWTKWNWHVESIHSQ